MPCNSDYLEPTAREDELRKAADLLLHVCKTLGHPYTKKLENAAANIYCTSDYIPQLCNVLSNMTETQRMKVMSDINDPKHRQLAEWWQRHQEADRVRIERERAGRAEDISDIAAELRQFGYDDLATQLEEREAKRK